MEQDFRLKAFVSYCHEDNLKEKPYIERFRKHLSPLRDNELIREWYDREIFAGEDYQEKIDNNLEDADIVLLFISANFLSSANCKKEEREALELRKKKGIPVVPIILSPCGWLDNEDISKLMALPTDGKPVSSYQDQDEGWQDVYRGLKKIIDKEAKILKLGLTEEFRNFLQDTEILTKAHSQKEEVLLEDIFVSPELDMHDDLREFTRRMNSDELLKDILNHPRIVIAGEGQSGKTTLCKIIYKGLRRKNFIPVYVSDKEHKFAGKIENRIARAFKEQYKGVDTKIEEIYHARIIPIVDDFHFAKKKENHIRDLSRYPYCVLTVDDIFSLNVSDETLVVTFDYLRIREFKPSLRDELIKKWVNLTDKEVAYAYNDLYKKVDKITELINTTIGKGIVPAYPFFILSAIVTYETFAAPLNQEITSQGYCYQALIYFSLRKEGVKNDEIDIYVNFLTELAFYFYKEKKDELSPEQLEQFFDLYLKKFTLPIKKELLLDNLKEIVSKDGLSNYSFHYPYLRYFFVAKHLAEHIEDPETEKLITKITANLHVNENAYIIIFMAHHSKNIKILDEIELTALSLFDKYKPATLTKDEVKFFDKQSDIIIKASLPPTGSSPEKERKERLKVQDKMEELQAEEDKEDEMKEADSLEKDLRRSIKTVEVMGSILKNRAGSIERGKLEEIFKEAMNVHLRILSSFFEIIKDDEEQEFLIDFLSKKIKKAVEKNKGSVSSEELHEIARATFWNFNFLVLCGLVGKIVHSLGSDKLIEIVEKSCDEVNTPATFLVKHGILMWYNKNLRIDEMSNKLDEKDVSAIAKSVLKLMVADYCSLHSINYKNRQRIESQLKIRSANFYKGK